MAAWPPKRVRNTSHHSEPRKKRKPTSQDQPNAARPRTPRSNNSQGTSPIHAHHGWLKDGNARTSKPALSTTNKNGDGSIFRMSPLKKKGGRFFFPRQKIDPPPFSGAVTLLILLVAAAW